MKQSILLKAVTTLFVGSMLANCMTLAQKVKTAQNNVSIANENLDKANKEYLEEGVILF